MTSIVHTTEMSHDMTGEPLNYVEQISIPRDNDNSQLIERGFHYHSGWMSREDGSKWDLYTKLIPVK